MKKKSIQELDKKWTEADASASRVNKHGRLRERGCNCLIPIKYQVTPGPKTTSYLGLGEKKQKTTALLLYSPESSFLEES